MTRPWISCLLLVGLLTAALPTSAHNGPHTLRVVATDELGRLALFYPADWTLTRDESNFTVTNEETQISVTARLLTHEPLAFDDLIPGLVAAGELPEGGAISAERYGGLDSWLLQGAGLIEADVYSALAVLSFTPDQSYLIRSDFPADQLSESAAFVTAILDKLVILPASVSSDEANLSAHLPAGWVFGTGIDSFLAASDAEDLRRISRNEVPLQFGVSIRFASDTTLDEQLARQTALDDSTTNFSVNGVTATLVLRQDASRGSVEALMVRQRSADSFLTMRVVASDADLLVSNIAVLQAIFASVRLQ